MVNPEKIINFNFEKKKEINENLKEINKLAYFILFKHEKEINEICHEFKNLLSNLTDDLENKITLSLIFESIISNFFLERILDEFIKFNIEKIDKVN